MSEGGGSDSEDNVSTSEVYDDIGDDDDDDVDFGEKGSKRKKGKAAKKGGRGNSKIAKVSIGPNDIVSGDIASGRAAIEDVNGTNNDDDDDDDDDSMGGGAAVDVDGADNESVEHRTVVSSSVSELVSAASNSSQVADNESGTAFAKRLIDKINSKGATKQACDLSEDLGKLWGVDQVSLNSQSAPDRVPIASNISCTLSCGVGPGTMSARSKVDEENFGSLLQRFNGLNVSTGEGSRETMHFPHECIAFAEIRAVYSHNLLAKSKALERPGLDNHIKSILASFELDGFQFSTLADQVTVVLDVLEFGEDADDSHEFQNLTPGFQHAFHEMWTEENTYGADDDYNGNGDGKMDESETLELEIECLHDDEEVFRDS